MASQFVWPVRVYYEDTDAGGVVYYANYLRFFERARTEWLRSLGMAQEALRAATGCFFVVREVTIGYLRPAVLDDALTVHAQLVHKGRASLVFEQWIERGGERLAEGRVAVVCVHESTLKPTPFPTTLSELLDPLVVSKPESAP